MLRPLIVSILAAALTGLAPQPAAAQPPEFPAAEFAPVDPALARLGQLLFYDPILSGNRNIACATCHHPSLATADGVSVSLGEGASGLGPNRRPDPANTPEQRLPRNAPALFNLGASEFTVMFHDGRVETDPARPSGYRSPLEEALPQGRGSALAAQAMFPVTSPDEMAGHYGENDVSQAVRLGLIAGPGGAWDLLARRVDAIPAYAEAFAAAIPDTAARPLHFADIAEALGAAGKGVLQVVSDFDDPQKEAAMLRRSVEQSGRPLSVSLAQADVAPEGWKLLLSEIEAAQAAGL